MDIPIIFDESFKEPFLKKIENDGPWTNWEMFNLALEAERYLLIDDFTGLVAPKFLPGLTPLPHQIETARQVIEEMNGRAILADEVGLGKTIEAGLILKEYMIRGLVKKVLILVPASLVTQWVYELNTKFAIPAIAYKKSYRWEDVDVMVSSIDTAKRSPHREIITSIDYDCIIIDEAHKLKNHRTKNYEFVQNLKKKFCLLLTATPIQNKIEEIFNLVSLLKPGHLGSYSEFIETYKKDKEKLKEPHLKKLIRKVMVRNRRKDTKIQWPERIVETILIELTPEEQDLYDYITGFKQSEDSVFKNAFSIITLQREATSSKEAVYMTCKNMLAKNDSPRLQEMMAGIMGRIERIQTNSKAEKALELIQKINDKVIIFTEYRATQLYLQWFLQQHGISSVPFRGGFRSGKKDWMRELFQTQAQVLIATEAGGEGINLQFCNHVINFDLPWNPMRLEQRIGRVHRLGQEKNVYIYNFATKNTIEEHILKLLYEKINLFELVIGELEDILTRLDFGNFEELLVEIFQESDSEGEIRVKMDNLLAMIELAQSMKEAGVDAANGSAFIS